MSRNKSFFSLFAMLALASSPAFAAISHFGGGDPSDAIRYVTETSKLGPLGTPTYNSTLGNDGRQTNADLSFSPDLFGFNAESGGGASLGGGGTDSNGGGTGSMTTSPQYNISPVHTAHGGFKVRIEAAKDYVITGIHWAEDGFYATQGTTAKVAAYAFLRASAPGSNRTLFRDAPNVLFTGDSAGFWDLTSDNPVAGNRGRVNLTVKNLLTASAQGSDWAWIEKDFANLRVDVAYRPGSNPSGFPGGAPVPVPASFWLLGSALASLVTIGRRRMSA